MGRNEFDSRSLRDISCMCYHTLFRRYCRSYFVVFGLSLLHVCHFPAFVVFVLVIIVLFVNVSRFFAIAGAMQASWSHAHEFNERVSLFKRGIL